MRVRVSLLRVRELCAEPSNNPTPTPNPNPNPNPSPNPNPDPNLNPDQPYTFECEPGSGLTVVSHNQHVIAAGGQASVIELVVDRACGDIELRLANALVGSGHWAEGLPLPASTPFVVREGTARDGAGRGTGTVKVRDVVGRAGARITPRQGLYVGGTYLLELESTELLLPASIEFTVVRPHPSPSPNP